MRWGLLTADQYTFGVQVSLQHQDWLIKINYRDLSCWIYSNRCGLFLCFWTVMGGKNLNRDVVIQTSLVVWISSSVGFDLCMGLVD